jgi:nitrate/TMAO reductase-like tetraheme cytochrome c subunit
MHDTLTLRWRVLKPAAQLFDPLSSHVPAEAVLSMHPYMTAGAIAFSLVSAGILLWFLWRRPELTGAVKIALFFGIGVFPIAAAGSGNIAGFEHTKHRRFCGSCHVMGPYRADAENPLSHSLASAHARNEEFGANNCYECHKDYGAFSTVMTKIGGMRHVYEYYTHYYKLDVKSALTEIKLYKPFANANCIRCHSTEGRLWLQLGDHRSSLAEVRSGRVSCVSSGCHGPSHPFSKPAAQAEGPR